MIRFKRVVVPYQVVLLMPSSLLPHELELSSFAFLINQCRSDCGFIDKDKSDIRIDFLNSGLVLLW